MKENSWKALVLAATIFLTSSCYVLKNNEKKGKEEGREPIEVISIKNLFSNNSSDEITLKGTEEVVFINPIPEVVTSPAEEKEISFVVTPQETHHIVATSLDAIANEVIIGNWGNGELRKQLLTEAGYDYNKVMIRVNELLGYTGALPESNESVITPNQNYNIKGAAAYVSADTVLYDENNNPICFLSKYDKVILGDAYIGTKRLVTVPYLYQGYVDINSLVNLPGTYIEVDISLQVTRMYIDNELVFEANVITGNPNKGNIPGTNLGCGQILRKEYQTYLVGDGYKEYVDVFLPFNSSEEGFHDADGWRSDSEFDNKSLYLTNGSHGCVNMRDGDAKTLAELAEVGNFVLVHK